ncbi:MAG TPA: hypothetical protein VK718_03200 [Ferruginibacter sp.]|nr:hypothetical protein [Ferruginibacter sp.]
MVNDTELYELKEQKPLLISANKLPVKIIVKNGFHLSKPYYINQPLRENYFIDIGCEADNERLWGSILTSTLLFVVFIATHLQLFMVMANLPLFYIMYKFFFKSKEFITVEKLNRRKKSAKQKSNRSYHFPIL